MLLRNQHFKMLFMKLEVGIQLVLGLVQSVQLVLPTNLEYMIISIKFQMQSIASQRMRKTCYYKSLMERSFEMYWLIALKEVVIVKI